MATVIKLALVTAALLAQSVGAAKLELSSPTNGAGYSTGENIVLNARASFLNGPAARVEFFAGQLLLGRYTGYRLSELFRFRDFLRTNPRPLSLFSE